jgi:hypothetical protein
MNTYSVDSKGPNVLIVRFDGISAGWEQWLLLSSDRHHDNKHCNRTLERQHLEKAKERGALIIDAGDLFCAMQGKYDPRSSMDDIRAEDVRQDYLDAIVIHAADDYGPYAENWLMIGRGNHETNIRKRHGTDLISNLVHRLNTQHEARAHAGGYGGWVRLVFKMNRTKSQSVNLKYFHGTGGDSPVTKGVIKTNRQAVYLPDADIVLNGHNHNAYHVPLPRERITQAGKVTRDVVDFVRTPGYKDEYNDGAGGFLVEGGNGPKPLGCAWVRFWFDATHSRIEREISLDAR